MSPAKNRRALNDRLGALTSQERAELDVSLWRGTPVAPRDLASVAVAYAARRQRRLWLLLPAWMTPPLILAAVFAFVVETRAFALFTFLFTITGGLFAVFWWSVGQVPARRMEAVNRSAKPESMVHDGRRGRVRLWALAAVWSWATVTITSFVLRDIAQIPALVAILAFVIIVLVVHAIAARVSERGVR